MAKNLRILLATPMYPPTIGGPATYAKLLHDELPKRGIMVDVVSFDSVRQYPKGIRHVLYFWMLLKASRGVTHIYAQDPVSVGLPALCASFVSRKRFWVKIVGDFAWEQGVHKYNVEDTLDDFSKKTHEYAVYVQILKKIQTFVAHRSEIIVVPSQYLRNIIKNWGVNSGKVHVIYNGFVGVDLGAKKNKETLRQELGLSGKIILSAGRLVPWKGYDTLIQLMPGLLSRFSDIHLYIAGDGPQKKTLESLIEKCGVQDHVTLLGVLPKSALHKYMSAGDVFVLHTQYEGLSHILLESLSLGLPIITTNVGGNPEVIEDGVSGRLVSYNDVKELSGAIQQMFLQSDVRDSYIAQGKVVAEKFSEEQMINNFFNIL